MATRKHKSGEYKFKIDAFTPATIPLVRLSEYLTDLARIMGEESSVHLARIESGSTVPVIVVDREAEPKVKNRIRAVKNNDAPNEAQRAFKEINRKLIEDNASAVLIDPAATKVIRFPGRDEADQSVFGPFRQAGWLQGVPIRIGGEKQKVSIHLEDGSTKHIVWADRRLAKQVAPFLFTSVVRIEGIGRWVRTSTGEWELIVFRGKSVKEVPDGNIESDFATLRAVPAKWKTRRDLLADLAALRTGKPQ